MSLRLFSALALGVLTPAGAFGQTPAHPTAALPPTPVDSANYRIEKIADGIYAFIAPDGITPMVSGNSTVIIGDNAVLVVDSGQFPSIAGWEIAHLKALTNKPVRWLVNTHWHPDHWLGNGTFRAAFPDVAIVSTSATLAAMHEDGQRFLDPGVAARTRNGLDRILSSGKGPQGSPLSDPDRAWYQYAAGEIRTLVPELERLDVVYPNVLFGTELTIELGHRSVQVRFPGRGNTAGDAVVYVPDSKVLVTGDLLVHPYPYAFGSFISEWIVTLGQLADLGPTSIVPGHGVVEHDRAYLDQVVELLSLVRSETGRRAQNGQSLEEVTRAIDLERFAEAMCGSSPFCRYGFRSSITAMIGRGYREAKEGKLLDEK